VKSPLAERDRAPQAGFVQYAPERIRTSDLRFRRECHPLQQRDRTPSATNMRPRPSATSAEDEFEDELVQTTYRTLRYDALAATAIQRPSPELIARRARHAYMATTYFCAHQRWPGRTAGLLIGRRPDGYAMATGR
jgi:hypothetical protein